MFYVRNLGLYLWNLALLNATTLLNIHAYLIIVAYRERLFRRMI